MQNRKLIAILAILLIAFAAVFSACGCNIPTRYYIEFDSKGGSPVETITGIHSGSTVSAPQDPIMDGYIFMGWYKDSLCKDYFDFSTTKIRQDWVLYAKWVDAMVVRFVTGDGTPVPNQNVLEGTRITRPADPTWENHVFENWYKDNDYTVLWDFDNDVVTENPTYVYAKWLNVFMVSFNTHGGRENIPSQTVIENDLAEIPDITPTKTGYTFVYWYEIADEYFDFDTPITRNITLHAKWQFVPYTVEFYCHTDDTAPLYIYDNLEYATLFAKPADPTYTEDMGDPDYEGYDFAGWYTLDGSGNYDTEWNFSTMGVPEGGVKLYAKWVKHEFTVVFYYNGERIDGQPDETVHATLEVNYLELFNPIPEIPERIGYRFLGWLVESYADIDIKDFDQNDYDDLIDQILEHRLDFTVPYDGSYRSYYAVWEVEYYTVTFLAPDSDDDEYCEIFEGFGYGSVIGNIVGFTYPERLGWTFEGWTLDPQAESIVLWDLSVDEITENIVLYAVWLHDIYVVTFDAHGGDPAPAQITPVYYGDTIQKPALDPQIDGKTFLGWTTEARDDDDENWQDYEWIFGEGGTQITGNVTIHACYALIKYSVTYVFDEENEETIGGYLYGMLIDTLTVPHLYVPGRGVAAWYKDPELENEWDFDDDILTGNMTLYARWEIEYYTVDFDSDGGSDVESILGVVYDELISAPVAPVKPGFTFGGWFTEDGEAWDFENDTVKDHMTLYARWENIIYTVIFMNNGVEHSRLTNLLYGDMIIRPTDPASRIGYTLEGWSTIINGTTDDLWNFGADTIAVYDPASSTYTLYVYAVWYGSSYLVYDYVDSVYGVIGYSNPGTPETVIGIPDYYNGEAVVCIHAGAFENLDITRIVFGSNIVYVGNGAFYGSSVSVIDFNIGLKEIGSMAFCASNIVHANLPEGLEIIGSLAFNACPLLQTVSVPSTVISIGDNAFIACSVLTEITFLMTSLNEVQFGSTILRNNNSLNAIYVPSGTAAEYIEKLEASMGIGWSGLDLIEELPAPVPGYVVLPKKED